MTFLSIADSDDLAGRGHKPTSRSGRSCRQGSRPSSRLRGRRGSARGSRRHAATGVARVLVHDQRFGLSAPSAGARVLEGGESSSCSPPCTGTARARASAWPFQVIVLLNSSNLASSVKPDMNMKRHLEGGEASRRCVKARLVTHGAHRDRAAGAARTRAAMVEKNEPNCCADAIRCASISARARRASRSRPARGLPRGASRRTREEGRLRTARSVDASTARPRSSHRSP